MGLFDNLRAKKEAKRISNIKHMALTTATKTVDFVHSYKPNYLVKENVYCSIDSAILTAYVIRIYYSALPTCKHENEFLFTALYHAHLCELLADTFHVPNNIVKKIFDNRMDFYDKSFENTEDKIEDIIDGIVMDKFYPILITNINDNTYKYDFSIYTPMPLDTFEQMLHINNIAEYFSASLDEFEGIIKDLYVLFKK